MLVQPLDIRRYQRMTLYVPNRKPDVQNGRVRRRCKLEPIRIPKQAHQPRLIPPHNRLHDLLHTQYVLVLYQHPRRTRAVRAPQNSVSLPRSHLDHCAVLPPRDALVPRLLERIHDNSERRAVCDVRPEDHLEVFGIKVLEMAPLEPLEEGEIRQCVHIGHSSEAVFFDYISRAHILIKNEGAGGRVDDVAVDSFRQLIGQTRQFRSSVGTSSLGRGMRSLSTLTHLPLFTIRLRKFLVMIMIIHARLLLINWKRRVLKCLLEILRMQRL